MATVFDAPLALVTMDPPSPSPSPSAAAMEAGEQTRMLGTAATTAAAAAAKPRRRSRRCLLVACILATAFALLILLVALDASRLSRLQLGVDSLHIQLGAAGSSSKAAATDAAAAAPMAQVQVGLTMHGGPRIVAARMQQAECTLLSSSSASSAAGLEPLLRVRWTPPSSEGTSLSWSATDATAAPLQQHALDLSLLSPLGVRAVAADLFAFGSATADGPAFHSTLSLSAECAIQVGVSVAGVQFGAWSVSHSFESVALEQIAALMQKHSTAAADADAEAGTAVDAVGQTESDSEHSLLMSDGSLNLRALLRLPSGPGSPFAATRSFVLSTPRLHYDLLWDWAHLLTTTEAPQQHAWSKYVSALQHLARQSLPSKAQSQSPLPLGVSIVVAAAELQFASRVDSVSDEPTEAILRVQISPILPGWSRVKGAVAPCSTSATAATQQRNAAAPSKRAASFVLELRQCNDEAAEPEEASPSTALLVAAPPAASRHPSFLGALIGPSHVLEFAPADPVPPAPEPVPASGGSSSVSLLNNGSLSFCFDGFLNARAMGGVGLCAQLGLYSDAYIAVQQSASLQLNLTQLCSFRFAESLVLSNTNELQASAASFVWIQGVVGSAMQAEATGMMDQSGSIEIHITERRDAEDSIDPDRFAADSSISWQPEAGSGSGSGFDFSMAVDARQYGLAVSHTALGLALNTSAQSLQLSFAENTYSGDFDVAAMYAAEWTSLDGFSLELQGTAIQHASSIQPQLVSNLVAELQWVDSSSSLSLALQEDPSSPLPPQLQDSRFGFKYVGVYAATAAAAESEGQTALLQIAGQTVLHQSLLSDARLTMQIEPASLGSLQLNLTESNELLSSASAGAPRIQSDLAVDWNVADAASGLSVSLSNGASYWGSSVSAVRAGFQYDSSSHQAVLTVNEAAQPFVPLDGSRFGISYILTLPPDWSVWPLSLALAGRTVWQAALVSNLALSTQVQFESRNVLLDLTIQESPSQPLDNYGRLYFNWALHLQPQSDFELELSMAVASWGRTLTNLALALSIDTLSRRGSLALQEASTETLDPSTDNVALSYTASYDDQAKVHVTSAGQTWVAGELLSNAALTLSFGVESTDSGSLQLLESSLPTTPIDPTSSRFTADYKADWASSSSGSGSALFDLSTQGNLTLRSQPLSAQRLTAQFDAAAQQVTLGLMESSPDSLARVSSSYLVRYNSTEQYSAALTGTTYSAQQLLSNLAVSGGMFDASSRVELQIQESSLPSLDPSADRVYFDLASAWMLGGSSSTPQPPQQQLSISSALGVSGQTLYNCRAAFSLQGETPGQAHFEAISSPMLQSLDPRGAQLAIVLDPSWSTDSEGGVQVDVRSEIWFQAALLSNATLGVQVDTTIRAIHLQLNETNIDSSLAFAAEQPQRIASLYEIQYDFSDAVQVHGSGSTYYLGSVASIGSLDLTSPSALGQDGQLDLLVLDAGWVLSQPLTPADARTVVQYTTRYSAGHAFDFVVAGSALYYQELQSNLTARIHGYVSDDVRLFQSAVAITESAQEAAPARLAMDGAVNWEMGSDVDFALQGSAILSGQSGAQIGTAFRLWPRSQGQLLLSVMESRWMTGAAEWMSDLQLSYAAVYRLDREGTPAPLFVDLNALTTVGGRTFQNDHLFIQLSPDAAGFVSVTLQDRIEPSNMLFAPDRLDVEYRAQWLSADEAGRFELAINGSTSQWGRVSSNALLQLLVDPSLGGSSSCVFLEAPQAEVTPSLSNLRVDARYNLSLALDQTPVRAEIFGRTSFNSDLLTTVDLRFSLDEVQGAASCSVREFPGLDGADPAAVRAMVDYAVQWNTSFAMHPAFTASGAIASYGQAISAQTLQFAIDTDATTVSVQMWEAPAALPSPEGARVAVDYAFQSANGWPSADQVDVSLHGSVARDGSSLSDLAAHLIGSNSGVHLTLQESNSVALDYAVSWTSNNAAVDVSIQASTGWRTQLLSNVKAHWAMDSSASTGALSLYEADEPTVDPANARVALRYSLDSASFSASPYGFNLTGLTRIPNAAVSSRFELSVEADADARQFSAHFAEAPAEGLLGSGAMDRINADYSGSWKQQDVGGGADAIEITVQGSAWYQSSLQSQLRADFLMDQSSNAAAIEILESGDAGVLDPATARLLSNYSGSYAFDGPTYALSVDGSTAWEARDSSSARLRLLCDPTQYNFSASVMEAPVVPVQGWSPEAARHALGMLLVTFAGNPQPIVLVPLAQQAAGLLQRVMAPKHASAALAADPVPPQPPAPEPTPSGGGGVVVFSPHFALGLGAFAKFDWRLLFDVSTALVMNLQWYADQMSAWRPSHLQASHFEAVLHAAQVAVSVPAALGFNLQSEEIAPIEFDVALEAQKCQGEACVPAPAPAPSPPAPIDSSSSSSSSSSASWVAASSSSAGGEIVQSSTGGQPAPVIEGSSSTGGAPQPLPINDGGLGGGGLTRTQKIEIGVGVSFGLLFACCLLLVLVGRRRRVVQKQLTFEESFHAPIDVVSSLDVSRVPFKQL